jgi:6-pyruvoyltetrahydropterin/6-carboxytetrahydropterin synthase
MNPKVAIFRKEHFNAAHRLHNPNWDDETNKSIFGKCNNPNYHGHNYDLIVKIIGYPEPETGYVIDTKKLSDIIKRLVIERFDHKNLNEDCLDFQHLNPTVENIAIVIYNLIRPAIDDALELQIRLFETENNFADFPASSNF